MLLLKAIGTSDFKNTDFVLITPLNAISQIDLKDSAGSLNQ